MFSALFFTPLSEFLLGEKHFLVVTMEDEGGNDHPVQPAATTPTGTVISVESDEENDAPTQPAAGAASASSTSGKKRSAICLKQKLEAIPTCLPVTKRQCGWIQLDNGALNDEVLAT